MEEKPLASMYIGDKVAWVDFHDTPLVLPLTKFDNNLPAADQSPEILKGKLEQICLHFLEKTNGFLPSGTIHIEQEVDSKFNVMVYKAYHTDLVPTPF